MPFLKKLEPYVTERCALVLFLIVAASLSIRAVYFLQLEQSPVLFQHRWEATDMNFFHKWALHISEGDLLTDEPFHPYSDWHKEVAHYYFQKYPHDLDPLRDSSSPGGERMDPARRLWEKWYGEKRFHQEPLYPYLVALTYRLFGPDVRWIFVAQMLFGTLTNVLIYLITRRYFGDLAAVFAGMFAVLCGPLLYYEGILLREALITFAGLGIVYVCGIVIEKRSLRWSFMFGIALGLALLLKSTFILFFAGFALFLLYHYRQRTAYFFKGLFAVALGMLLGVSPAIARNVIVGAPPLSLSSVATLTFINANNARYSPSAGFSVHTEETSEIMRETNGRFLPSVVKTLQTHESLGSYLNQVWGKFRAMWNWYEIPNNANFYFYQLNAPVLKFTFVTFYLLAPLSFLGLILAIAQKKNCWPLYLLVAMNVICLLGFYVLSRFRITFLAALIPFAAFSTVEISRSFPGRIKNGLALLAGFLIIFLWTSRPLAANGSLIRPADYVAPIYYYYRDAVRDKVNRRDFEGAARTMSHYLRYEPKKLQTRGRVDRPSNNDEREIMRIFAQAHLMYADLLRKAGKESSAKEQEEIAIAQETAAGVR